MIEKEVILIILGGLILGFFLWRQDKKKKEQDKKTKQFEEYERVCTAVDEHEKLKDKAVGNMTVPQLKVFIEVRTTEKVKGQPGKAALLQLATAKKDDEVRLRKPSVPEGYAAWKQQQAQAATAAAAAALGRQPT